MANIYVIQDPKNPEAKKDLKKAVRYTNLLNKEEVVLEAKKSKTFKNIKKKNMIHHATDKFDFSTLHLGSPTALAGGSFYTKLNYSVKDEPLYVYTPSCTTKQGVTKGILDFLFTSANSNFIDWVNALEERLQALLFEKKDHWFIGDDMELEDIQNAFIPLLKVKGNQYMVRGYVQGKHFKETIQVYNEDEIPVPLSSIQENSQLISILDISGIII